MTNSKKPLEVEFAPGCFDDFEGTEEELGELIAEIYRLVESGEFMEQARPLTEEEEEWFAQKMSQDRNVQ